MNIRVTSVGNTEDGGWLIEFTRDPFGPVASATYRKLTTVIALPRNEGENPMLIDSALHAAAGIARAYFIVMDEWNKSAEAHRG